MPREQKGDILGEQWEYTLLADDFSEIDDDAKAINPSAGTMLWRGYSYPEIAFSIRPKSQCNGINGPWWLPDDLLWHGEDLLLSILSKAVIMESVPVIKDHMLLDSSVEIVRQETVRVPINKSPKSNEQKTKLSAIMSRLVTCAEDDKEACFTEIVQEIKSIHHKDEESYKFRLCLVKFPHRIWVEGIYHMRLHPIIVIPTNIYERYHEAN